MNKRLENKLTMYEGLLTLLQDNSARVESISGFGDAVTKLSGTLKEIKTKSIEVDSVSAGTSSGKRNAQDALIECLLPVCAALYLFGRKESNVKIMERAGTTETKLRAMRDTELGSYGSEIAVMADENSQGISPVGITAEKIADLKAKSEAYTTSIGARESSIAGRKGARGALNELFGSVDEHISEEIDNYMELIRLAEPEFYNKYYAAKTIKETGVRHRQEEPAPAAAGAAVK